MMYCIWNMKMIIIITNNTYRDLLVYLQIVERFERGRVFVNVYPKKWVVSLWIHYLYITLVFFFFEAAGKNDHKHHKKHHHKHDKNKKNHHKPKNGTVSDNSNKVKQKYQSIKLNCKNASYSFLIFVFTFAK